MVYTIENVRLNTIDKNNTLDFVVSTYVLGHCSKDNLIPIEKDVFNSLVFYILK